MSADIGEPDGSNRLAVALAERIASGGLELPVLPEAAAQVVSRTGDPNCDFKVVAELIRNDQAMASHLLRIANSSLYRPRSKIVSLQQALSRLGLTAVREIALLISVKTRTFQVDGFAREVKVLFRHSLGTAVYAQEIARLRRLNVEEAFLCGLLHDVGRPVLLQALVDLCKELRMPADKSAIENAATEHHARAGSALAAKWALPDVVAGTILYHHDPPSGGGQTAMITALADEIAHVTLDENPEDETALRAHPALAALNIYPEDVDALLAHRERVAEVVVSIG